MRSSVSILSTYNFYQGLLAIGVTGQDSMGDIGAKMKALGRASLPGGSKGAGNLKYDDRVLRRMSEDAGTHHNFPKVFDETIVSRKPYVIRQNGRAEYLMKGTINKQEGIYQITLEGDIIKHRSFIPKSDWTRYSKRWELPTWDKIIP